MGNFYQKLIDLEAEIIAKAKDSSLRLQTSSILSGESIFLLDSVEREIGMRLAVKTDANWSGWLYFRRPASLLICRGRAFKEGLLFPTYRAGLDFLGGLSTIAEAMRGFDVTPPAEMDHLLLSFSQTENPRVLLWYAENTAAYRLIFEAEVENDPVHELHDAVAEACRWVVNRPKRQTLLEYLKELDK